MFNEENREKAVFEDFGFDATDADNLAQRENETIELIKAGKLPVREIDGHIDIKLENCIGLPKVPEKDFCFYKLVRHFYDKDGVKQKRKVLQGFCKKFKRDENDPKTAIIDCRVKADDMFKENLHA